MLRYQRVIRSRKTKKYRQHNDQKKRDKRTNNDLQNTTQNIKDLQNTTQNIKDLQNTTQNTKDRYQCYTIDRYQCYTIYCHHKQNMILIKFYSLLTSPMHVNIVLRRRL